jgi:hypothetical protein
MAAVVAALWAAACSGEDECPAGETNRQDATDARISSPGVFWRPGGSLLPTKPDHYRDDPGLDERHGRREARRVRGGGKTKRATGSQGAVAVDSSNSRQLTDQGSFLLWRADVCERRAA